MVGSLIAANRIGSTSLIVIEPGGQWMISVSATVAPQRTRVTCHQRLAAVSISGERRPTKKAARRRASQKNVVIRKRGRQCLRGKAEGGGVVDIFNALSSSTL